MGMSWENGRVPWETVLRNSRNGTTFFTTLNFQSDFFLHSFSMSLYSITDKSTLPPVNEQIFRLEKDIQKQSISRDVANIGHWGNGDYEIQIRDDEHIDYIMELIKQSWRRNKK